MLPNSRAIQRAAHTPYCCGEEDEQQNVRPPGKDIAQWTQKQQAGCITRLCKCRDQTSSFIADTKFSGQEVQNWMAVVEIRNSESTGEAK